MMNAQKKKPRVYALYAYELFLSCPQVTVVSWQQQDVRDMAAH